jgi:HEAT repeat protein
MQAQFDVQGLIEALKNEDPGIRKRAAAALRTLGAVEAVPGLQKALEVEKDADARNNISAALDYLLPDQAETLTMLIAQLKSIQPDIVLRAAKMLGDLKDKTAVESLVMVFYNVQLPGKVRLEAAEALIKLESAPAVVTLLAALRHADWRIRRNAIAVLGQLRADWAVDAIVVRLNDEHEIVRRTARAAIKRIGTPEAFQGLEAADKPKAQTARLPSTQPLDSSKVETLEHIQTAAPEPESNS